MSGKHVNPRIVTDYDGNDIVLNQEQGIVLSPADFLNSRTTSVRI